MKKFNIVTTTLALILSTIHTSYAKDLEIDYYAGISFAKTDLIGKGSATAVDGSYQTNRAANNDDNAQDIDFVIGTRFTIFNQFTISPELLFLDNKASSSYRAHEINSGGNPSHSSNINVNHSTKFEGLAHLKLGYLVNKKTNFYGSVGLLKANNKLNHRSYGDCSASFAFCDGNNSNSVDVSQQYQLKKDSHVVYGFGMETKIADHFLLDLSYLISEKENYSQNISFVNAIGDTIVDNINGSYQYERLAVNLKYVF